VEHDLHDCPGDGSIDCNEEAEEHENPDVESLEPPVVGRLLHVVEHVERVPARLRVDRVEIERHSSANILSVGFRTAAFPTEEWFITGIMLAVLTAGPESILHRLLVDTGKASSVEASIEPTSEENLVQINITLAPSQNHKEIEDMALNEIESLTPKILTLLVRKAKAKMVAGELFNRSRSLGIAQELTEYVASGHWEAYAKTPTLLKNITVKNVIHCIKESFVSSQMTIGYFKGKA